MKQFGLSDTEIVKLVRSGNSTQVATAVDLLVSDGDLIASIRRRIRGRLEKRAIVVVDRDDAEGDAIFWIYERVLSAKALPDRLEKFDPGRGSLSGWLRKAADLQLNDWFKSIQDKDSPRSVSDSHEIATEIISRSNETDGAERRDSLEKTHRSWCEVFSTLSEMPRACMLVMYIDDQDRTVLDEADIEILLRVRNGLAKSAPSIGLDAMAMRDDLDGLRLKVNERKEIYQVLDCNVAFRHEKCQAEQRKRERYRLRLINNGQNDNHLALLENRACESSLDQIKDMYANNKWCDERYFVEATHRAHTTRSQLEAARSALSRANPDPRPEPREIAEFLNKTTSAVYPALSRAHKELRELGFPFDNARVDDESS